MNWNNLLSFFLIFLAAFIPISVISILFYKAGIKWQQKDHDKKISQLIPTSVFGMLALIVSFSFSMATTRYEARRSLAVQEANSIKTAYLRVSLLKKIPGIDIKKLYGEYVDSRVAFFLNADPKEDIKRATAIQTKLWQHFQKITEKDKTAMESLYGFGLNDMFDVSTSRIYAIQKTLPLPIYFIIMLIAAMAFSLLNFERGYQNERSHLVTFGFIAIFSLFLSLIYDIDHSRDGLIIITQDAMLEVQKEINL